MTIEFVVRFEINGLKVYICNLHCLGYTYIKENAYKFNDYNDAVSICYVLNKPEIFFIKDKER